MIIPYQIDSIQGRNGKIETLTVKNLSNEKKLKLITFYPFSVYQQIRPNFRMGVRNRKKILRVDQTSCQTSKREFMG